MTLHLLRSAAFGDGFPDLCSGGDVRACALAGAKLFLRGVRGSEGLSRRVVDDLGIDMRPEKWTARRGRSAVPATFLRMRRWRNWRLLVDADMATGRFCLPCGEPVRRRNARPCPCKVPAGNSADIRGHLADELLVDAFDRDLGVFRHRDFDVLRNWKQDRVGFAEAQIEVLALDRRLESDAFDLELLREAFADARTMLVTRRAKGRGAPSPAGFAVAIERNACCPPRER